MFSWFWNWLRPRQETPPDGALRKLGWLESGFMSFCKIANGGHLKFTLFLKTQFEITHELMYKALVGASQRHPLLQSRVITREGREYYVPMEEWEGKLRLETSVNGDWQEISAEGFRSGFDIEKGPLWQAYLVDVSGRAEQIGDSCSTKSSTVNQYALILMFNHAIIDGKSAAVVLNDIVRHVNYAVDNASQSSAGEESMLTVAPPLEDALLPAAHPGVWDYLKIFQFMRRLLSAPKNPYMELYPARILREPHVEYGVTKIVDFSIPLDPLLQRCRAEKVTIQGAATAAASLAMLDLLRKKAPNTPRLSASSDYVVDFRRFCEPVLEPMYMGFYAISNTMPPLNVTGTVKDRDGFWDLAREASNEIRRYISNPEEPIKTFRVLCQVANMETFANVMIKNMKTGLRNELGFGISNIGDVESLVPAGQEGDAVEATKILWATNGAMFGAPFYHYILSMRGFLVWSLNWYPNISTKEEALAYANNIQEALTNAVA